MSRSEKFSYGRPGSHDTDFSDHQPGDESLPSAVRSLENEELRILLVALLSEWRTRTARGFHA